MCLFAEVITWLNWPPTLYGCIIGCGRCLTDFILFRQNGAVSQQQHLLLILPSIRQAEHIVRKFWIDVYRSGNINMKKLFVEMLESVSK